MDVLLYYLFHATDYIAVPGIQPEGKRTKKKKKKKDEFDYFSVIWKKKAKQYQKQVNQLNDSDIQLNQKCMYLFNKH